ncbi:MAG: isopenicillin N synthase family dioxygenase [Solimonas sp.]
MNDSDQAAPAFAVPVVDISPYVAGPGARIDPMARARAAAELGLACRDVGFVQVRGHGISPAVIAGLATAMDAFFAQPLQTKQRYRTPPQINRGYTPPQSESLSLSLGVEPAAQLKDYFEAYNVGTGTADHPQLALPADVYADNLWPDSGAGFDGRYFRDAVSAYFGEAGRVARTLCRIFADALGVPAQTFAAATDHSVDVLRMNHYALPPGLAVGDALPTGMGAHTDYGIVTVLWADAVPGLQVLGGDGIWHDVLPIQGALLVNIGDLTARWTNDRWRSTLHRVQPPVVGGHIRRRRSAAYFHDGNYDALIATLPSCVGLDGRAYPPITVAEHLSAKLAGSRAGRANTAAGSEAERVRAAGA